MFTGSIVALITPLRNNIIDIKALEKIIEWQINSGTDGILVCGSTGEGLLLNDDEREEIISTSISIANGRAKIIVGCSACSTTEAIKLVNQAEKLKADGVLVIAPYYVKPTQEGIKEHFASIHNNSNIPIIMYNNPGRCAINMTAETIADLAQKDRIVALKDSDINLAKATLIRRKVSESFSLLSGDDSTLAGYLAHGGNGAISVIANVEPYLVKKMISAWKNGDINAMQNINEKLTPLNSALFVEPNPIPVKYVLYKKGFIANELRLPLTPVSQKAMETIDFILSEF
ncbi:MAG: 4-hydroxy-tetrahydrodipicolinate synthase [Holosporales bacterium]|jgi:4-hydroxy-tetrahydrodipicolinate synthase|nr:4-hydroxy-tetrahydrodipicolinate synthase [Holosporales bacterium]